MYAYIHLYNTAQSLLMLLDQSLQIFSTKIFYAIDTLCKLFLSEQKFFLLVLFCGDESSAF